MSTPTTLPMTVARPRAVCGRMAATVQGRWWFLAAVIGVLIGAAALGLVTPWALGRIVDIAIDDSGFRQVWQLGGLMVAAAFGYAVLTGLGVALSSQLFETMLARLREQMLDAVLRLPLARVEAAGSGDVVSRATDDVSVVSDAISRAVPALSTSGFTIVLTGIGLAVLDWRYLVVFVVLMPVYVVGVRMYLREAPQVYAAERVAMAERAHHVLGAIRGLETVYAFGLSAGLGARIADRSWDVVRWALRARIVQNRFFGKINLGEYLGMATILIVGYNLVGAGMSTVGATTTAMLFFLRLFGPISALLLVIDDLQSGAASLGRIVGVIEEAEGHAPPAAVAQNTAAGAALSAESVSFGYSAEHPVLQDVSIRLSPGEQVAVVGASGAGKTTLALLLAGVHPVSSGRICLGGTDVRELEGCDRARRIAMVTQDVHVFAGPLAADLRMVAPDASDAALRSALEAVFAWDWVSALDDGMDTVVGAAGVRLTPVQVQQVALARLLLLDPQVVILDEATADAGSYGAEALERSAQAAIAGRSALIIAHRLSQAAMADRIVLMDKGRIVESGTHADLVAAGGRYARLWSAWSRDRDGSIASGPKIR